jgi:hypothetical protein
MAFLLEIQMPRNVAFRQKIEMPVISQNLQRHDLHVDVEFDVLIAVIMERPLFWDSMQDSPF